MICYKSPRAFIKNSTLKVNAKPVGTLVIENISLILCDFLAVMFNKVPTLSMKPFIVLGNCLIKLV